MACLDTRTQRTQVSSDEFFPELWKSTGVSKWKGDSDKQKQTVIAINENNAVEQS